MSDLHEAPSSITDDFHILGNPSDFLYFFIIAKVQFKKTCNRYYYQLVLPCFEVLLCGIVIFCFVCMLRVFWKHERSAGILVKQLQFKTDSAQSSSNNCKNYLQKICSQHINSPQFVSPGDPAMKIPSIFEKFNVKPRKNASCLCFQLTRNVRFKDVRANCFCAYLLRTQNHAKSSMSARALSIKINNDREDGHCYSFAWI